MLHARSEEYIQKIQEAEYNILTTLLRYKKPYVAFSGGKDSTCMLHLVLQQALNTMILHWDYGRFYIPYYLHNELIENARRCGAKNLRIETSSLYEKLGRKAINVLGKEMMEKLIPQLIKEGYDVVFVGLRIQESVKRKLRIKAGRSLTNIFEVWPLKNWSWLDVWAYIISSKIPYLSYYDKYAPVVGWDKARFTTLFDPEFDKFGCSNVDGILSWKYRNLI